MSDLEPPAAHRDVVVLGAGIIGLTSAVALAEAGRPVTLWTADDPADTTSARSAGVWSPIPQAPLDTTIAWAGRSMQTFCDLGRRPGSGVSMLEGLTLDATDIGSLLPALSRLSPGLRPATPDELPEGFSHGRRYRTPVIDMERYVPWMLDRLDAHGGKVRVQRADSLDEALAEAPVVVNATGLAARDLAGDPTVRPLFCQYVVTDNPGLDSVLVDASRGGTWVSVIPHHDRVHLGGARAGGRTDPRPDRELASDVLRWCREIEPRLRHARTIRVDTGLLPTRPTMRVEAENRRDGLVVHAYGHATGGITVSWGAAADVVRLVAAG